MRRLCRRTWERNDSRRGNWGGLCPRRAGYGLLRVLAALLAPIFWRALSQRGIGGDELSDVIVSRA